MSHPAGHSAAFEFLTDSAGEGTRHGVGDTRKPAPTPGFFTLLLLDALDTGGAEGAELLARVREFTAEAVRRRGAGHLASRINCHILVGEYPFDGGFLGLVQRRATEGNTPTKSPAPYGRQELGCFRVEIDTCSRVRSARRPLPPLEGPASFGGARP